MEHRGIDLRKFAPQKANKWYIIKVLIYAIVLAGLIFYLFIQLHKKDSQVLDQTTVRGVEIDLQTN
jgi:polyferredoxin